MNREYCKCCYAPLDATGTYEPRDEEIRQILAWFVANRDAVKYGALGRGIWREAEKLLQSARELLIATMAAEP